MNINLKKEYAAAAPGRPKQGQPRGAESDTKRKSEQASSPSRGRGTGFAGPQAQRPPRGAESDTKCANVGAMFFMFGLVA